MIALCQAPPHPVQSANNKAVQMSFEFKLPSRVLPSCSFALAGFFSSPLFSLSLISLVTSLLFFSSEVASDCPRSSSFHFALCSTSFLPSKLFPTGVAFAPFLISFHLLTSSQVDFLDFAPFFISFRLLFPPKYFKRVDFAAS